MVYTWIGDVRPLLQGSCYTKYWRQLPDHRREKADRYRFPMGRALSAGVWILWQQARRALDLPPDAPFNLSHSGYYALCAAADGTHRMDGPVRSEGPIQVGCDVEQITAYRDGIARRFFCPREYAHIQAQKDPDMQRLLFFRYWVLKESFMKATRQGMAMGLDSFCLDVADAADGADPVLHSCPGPYERGSYHFREFDLGTYRAAVCSTDPTIAPLLHWITF